MAENPAPGTGDGPYTLYDGPEGTITLTFPANSNAGFTVVTKDVPPDQPSDGKIWVFNFGIKNKAGNYLPSVTYNLSATARTDGKDWYVYYSGRSNRLDAN